MTPPTPIQLANPREAVFPPAPNWNTVEVVFERSCDVDGQAEAHLPDLPGAWRSASDLAALLQFFGFVAMELRDYEAAGETETRAVSWRVFP